MSIKKRSIVLLHGMFPGEHFDALKKRRLKRVHITEGRPSLKAARASSRQLLKRDMQPVLIADNMAGFLFARNLVKEVHIAYQDADQKGALGPVGALILAVLGKKHKVPVRLFKGSGRNPLMGRSRDLKSFNGTSVAPKNVQAYVPLAEWIPGKYITAKDQ